MKKDGYRAKKAVPALINCFKDNTAEIRSMSSDVLGAIGADTAAATVPLNALLEDADPAVRGSARNALKQIGSAGKER